MPHLIHRKKNTLPETKLPWLSLRDHFISTVGPSAGQGQAMGSALVLADATFAPKSRFPMHPHRDVEILSIVLEGELSHHGDQANGGVLGPRSVQLISAGDGIIHAEGNDSDTPTRMLQLWFRPEQPGGEPAYFTRTLEENGRFVLAGDASMPLRAKVQVLWIDLIEGAEERLIIGPGKRGYLMAMTTSARITVPDHAGTIDLKIGDGLEVGPGSFIVSAGRQGAVLWLDID